MAPVTVSVRTLALLPTVSVPLLLTLAIVAFPASEITPMLVMTTFPKLAVPAPLMV